MPTVGYATTTELARLLKVNEATYIAQLTEVLTAAQVEIDAEIDLADDATALTASQLTLAAQVQLERSVEHWHARPVGFGILGLDSEAPVRLARDTWDRHAFKLAPLKNQWGLA